MHDALWLNACQRKIFKTLWQALADWFGHYKLITPHTARHNWTSLRFQDYKYVYKYYSKVCKIRSPLKYCEEDVIKHDILEKTYSTFHAMHIVLEHQYRSQNSTKFSYFIYVLSIASHSQKFHTRDVTWTSNPSLSSRGDINLANKNSGSNSSWPQNIISIRLRRWSSRLKQSNRMW